MATSAFKSTTKRTPIGTIKSKSEDSYSSTKLHRRSRSLSRFSRHFPESESDLAEVPVTRDKFVNTTRGSGFPEISLDDLAIEFFPLKNSVDEQQSARGRLSRGNSDVSPVTSQTPSSQRRGRSVSRQSTRASDGKSSVYNKLDSNSSRRRSVSVARYQISDSEQSDIERSQRSNLTSSVGENRQIVSSQKPASMRDRRLGRSLSQIDLFRSHDGYLSPSSVLTDDEVRNAHYGKNDGEKTIRAVYAQKKAQHPTGEDVSSGLYQAMRKELRYAVEEIRTEIEQAMVRKSSTLTNADGSQSGNSDMLRAVSAITKNYTTKLEQSEKRKQDLLAEILLEEHRGKELSKIVRELIPESAEKPLRARKRSNDKTRMSKRLTEEAEKYFEDFISNVEDTDISSIDGERSDTSSTLGGMTKSREAAQHCGEKTEAYQGRTGNNSLPVEMDGVILPWLEWETRNDGTPLPNKITTRPPVTPKTLLWDTAQDTMQDSSGGHSSSSHGSWSPGPDVHSIYTSEVRSSERSRFDMDKYVKLQSNEELMFERWRERDRIHSGGLLLCSHLI